MQQLDSNDMGMRTETRTNNALDGQYGNGNWNKDAE